MPWNLSQEKNILWKTWFLLSESIFSIRPNIIVSKHYILLDIQVIVVVKPVFYTTRAGQWPPVQTYMWLWQRWWVPCAASAVLVLSRTLLQIFSGELCFNPWSHMHLWYHGHQGNDYCLCPVVMDARKIDGWILLFDCLWISFWNLILGLVQVFRTSASVCQSFWYVEPGHRIVSINLLCLHAIFLLAIGLTVPKQWFALLCFWVWAWVTAESCAWRVDYRVHSLQPRHWWPCLPLI
jgi:hypothetical protein